VVHFASAIQTILMLTKGSIEDVADCKQGKYYQCMLSVTNQASSTLLTELVPWGGTAADALNIAGAVATAYAYGFFWGL
jgi:hypothetical protein